MRRDERCHGRLLRLRIDFLNCRDRPPTQGKLFLPAESGPNSARDSRGSTARGSHVAPTAHCLRLQRFFSFAHYAIRTQCHDNFATRFPPRLHPQKSPLPPLLEKRGTENQSFSNNRFDIYVSLHLCFAISPL